jgi:hypothetical protein
MNKLVEMGRTKIDSPMRVYYNTNFSKLEYKGNDVIELWKKFDMIGVGASIDASGKRGEYLRKGTIWKDIVANRKRMLEECPDIDFHVSATVSLFNALDITDFFMELIDTGFLKPEEFAVNILLGKPVHRATVLPEKYRKEAQRKIESLLEWIEGKDKLGRTTNTFKAFHSFLDGDDTHLLDEALADIKEMDRFRAETFFDVHPEFIELKERYDEIVTR